MENTTKTWQEELANSLSDLTPEQKKRANDFLTGYLAAMKEAQTHEEDRV